MVGQRILIPSGEGSTPSSPTKLGILEDIANGMAAGDIAKKYKMSRKTVKKIAASHNLSIKRKSKLYDPAPFLEYLKRHPETTSKEMAKHFGFSLSTLYNYLKRCGVPLSFRRVYSSKAAQKINIAEMLELIENNPKIKVKDLAEHFSCTRQAIHGALKSTGQRHIVKARV